MIREMWDDGIELYISEESAGIVREMRAGCNSKELVKVDNGPISETGLREPEVEELGWGRVGIGEGERGILITDGNVPGMDRLEMLARYSISFSPRVGERLEQ